MKYRFGVREKKGYGAKFSDKKDQLFSPKGCIFQHFKGHLPTLCIRLGHISTKCVTQTCTTGFCFPVGLSFEKMYEFLCKIGFKVCILFQRENCKTLFFGNKICQERATTIQLALLSYIFKVLFRDTPFAHIFSYACSSTLYPCQ